MMRSHRIHIGYSFRHFFVDLSNVDMGKAGSPDPSVTVDRAFLSGNLKVFSCLSKTQGDSTIIDKSSTRY